MTRIKRTRLLFTALTAIFIIGGSAAAISFARGYRPNLKGGTIHGTGLLSATSHPKSAQVFIDGKLTSATDATINLLPGDYQIRIVKEGFLPWEKTLKIQAELVSATDARLFPAVPSLAAITYTGSIRPETSPDGRRIVYLVTDAVTEDKKGLYVMDTGNSPLSFNRSPVQISPLHSSYEMDNAQLLWSPDSKQVLLAFFDPEKDNVIQASYLLDTNSMNNLATIPDVSVRLSIILSGWEQELYQNQTAQLDTLPDFMVSLATASANNLYFSPDQEKIVYLATASVTIPDNLKPAVSSVNPTTQARQLEPGNIYVYDIKEDTNYHLGEYATSHQLLKTPLVNKGLTPTTGLTSTSSSGATQTLFNQLQKDVTLATTFNLFKAHYSPLYTAMPIWYQTSRHLITTTDSKITIFEYDFTNHSVVYSGPFDPSFLMSSPTGDRLLILTNLNQNDAPTNLYSLDLK